MCCAEREPELGALVPRVEPRQRHRAYDLAIARDAPLIQRVLVCERVDLVDELLRVRFVAAQRDPHPLRDVRVAEHFEHTLCVVVGHVS